MSREEIQDLASREYKYGFVTDIEADRVPPGLSEDVVRLISAKKQEPNGCSTGGSRPTGTGSRCKSRLGRR